MLIYSGTKTQNLTFENIKTSPNLLNNKTMRDQTETEYPDQYLT